MTDHVIAWWLIDDPARHPEQQAIPTQRFDWFIDRLAFSIDELSERTSIGRQKIYDDIAAGRLIARKEDRRTVILTPEAVRWLVNMPLLKPATTVTNMSATMVDEDRVPTKKNRPSDTAWDENATRPPGTPLGPNHEVQIRARERSQQIPKILPIREPDRPAGAASKQRGRT